MFVEVRKDYFARGGNIFVINAKDAAEHFRFLSHPLILGNLISFEEFNRQFILTGALPRDTKIFFHFLHQDFYKFITELPESIPIFWIFWGGDFYSPLSKYASSILDPKTRKLYFETRRLGRFLPFPTPIKQKIIFLYDINNSSMIFKQKAIKRINYFLHWNEKDYLLVKNEYESNMEFVFFRYSLWESSFSLNSSLENKGKENKKTGILFGNSALFTNNHLDGLDVLYSKITPEDATIYCPLSYGPKEVADRVVIQGTALYKDSFLPLLQFMAYDEYWTFVRENVDILFMNHIRTQAAGNIVRSIASGKKVYMRYASTLFQLLRGNGVTVFSIDDDFMDSDQNRILAPLTRKEQEENYVRIKEVFSDVRVIGTYSVLL